MNMLNNTDPKRLDAYFQKWRYDAAKRQANEMSMGNFGMRATISSINVITFSLRMRVKGERRSKAIGRFKVDSDGTVVYGARKALADCMQLRELWHDEMEGKITVAPSDIPTFAGMLERYEEALTDPEKIDTLLMSKKLPDSWPDQRTQRAAIYAPLIEANNGKGVKVNFLTKDAIQECYAKYLVKRLRETGHRPHQTVRLIHNAVMPVLKWANEKNWLPDSTLKGLRANVPDGEQRKRVVLPGEWQAVAPVLDTFHADADVGLCMRFMFATACRRSMATQMTWGQLETVDASAHGRKELTLWCVPGEEMKMGALALFPIVGESARILDVIRNRSGARCKDHEFVFSSVARNAWDNNPDHWQKRIFELSGTKEWTRHDLRRTTASLLETFGADESTIKKLLAHRARTDKSATGGYLGIGKNLAALVRLAGPLERVHKLIRAIEEGQETADLLTLYSELRSSDDVRTFMGPKALDIDKRWIAIEKREKPAATNVTPIRGRK